MTIDVLLAATQSGLCLELLELGQLVEHYLAVGCEFLAGAIDFGGKHLHRPGG
jgi:hypothetical protein